MTLPFMFIYITAFAEKGVNRFNVSRSIDFFHVSLAELTFEICPNYTFLLENYS